MPQDTPEASATTPPPKPTVTLTHDVVVVGGGGGGLAAAIEAAELGRSVILLEKNPSLGGTTSWSVGSISATNTPHQRKAGIKDTPQEHFEDLALHAGPLAERDNLRLRRILVESTTEMMAWLHRSGVVFTGPLPEPPHRYNRMHNVLPNSRAFAHCLERRARKVGVTIRTGMTVRDLEQRDGRIVGVRATDPDGEGVLIEGTLGVILTTGDYSASRELRAELASEEAASLEPVNASSTGDGHTMARKFGARVVNGDIVRGPILRFVPPKSRSLISRLPPYRWVALGMRWAAENLPESIRRPFLMSFLTTALGLSPELFKAGGVFVNAKGERFANELDKPARFVPAQPERQAYVVFDDAIAKKFTAWPHFISTAPGVAYAYLDDYRRNRPDVYKSGDTVQDLASKLGMEPETLSQAIQTANTERTGQESDLPQLGNGPYHALGPVKAYMVFTDGGLAVNERMEVLDGDDQPIYGLYAAGSAGQGGVLLEGHGHHLGWAFISGRIAGRNAALSHPEDLLQDMLSAR